MWGSQRLCTAFGFIINIMLNEFSHLIMMVVIGHVESTLIILWEEILTCVYTCVCVCCTVCDISMKVFVLLTMSFMVGDVPASSKSFATSKWFRTAALCSGVSPV